MEEIKEVELISCRGKFIYNKTYNPVGSNNGQYKTRTAVCGPWTADWV